MTRSRLLALLLGLALALGAALRTPLPGAQALATNAAPPLVRVRVRIPSEREAQALLAGGWDVLEARAPEGLYVNADPVALKALSERGFEWALDAPLPPLAPRAPELFDGGYHTVEEHIAHLRAVSDSHPALTTVITYGVSWRREQNAADGHDLFALCVTEKRPGDCARTPETDKPRFVLMASIHARELTPAEVAYRLIDALVDGYGQDAEITALLRDEEIWILPVTNPDGREIVEAGGNAPYLQRKNANTSAGSCAQPPQSYSQFGVDLNRNADWRWGVEGVSADPCSPLYLGGGPASEPETRALIGLFEALFKDQRGPLAGDAAPITTTGALLTLHSYSNLVLLPWGNSGPGAPNDAGLRAAAFRMSFFNGYVAGRPPEVLYGVSGSTDDAAYGGLGVAAFTWEMGLAAGETTYPHCAGFLPAFDCQAGRFWPEARAGLLYLAAAARQPYALALGPTVLTASLDITASAPGAVFTVTARLADDALGAEAGSVGRPASQPVAEAEAYVDLPPWRGGTPIALLARDGGFDQPREVVAGAITAPNDPGLHLLYVRGQDASGQWGPVHALWLPVQADAAPAIPVPPPAPAGACLSVTVSATVPVTDSLGVMNCIRLPVPDHVAVASLRVRMAVTHPWVGDLRLQVRNPEGLALTLLNRPGGGTRPADLFAGAPILFSDAASASASALGEGLGDGVVCGSGGPCAFTPAPAGDPTSDLGRLADFSGGAADGVWEVCAADHAPYSAGALVSATLEINCGPVRLYLPRLGR